MIKHFCDVTGKEIQHPQTLTFKKHIVSMHYESLLESLFGGYVDPEGNRVSNVEVTYEVSQEVYNRVMLTAMKELAKIIEENKDADV